MNKKLIVTAMGLVMAGAVGLANADVKLYGQLDVSLNWTDSDSPGFEDDINMTSNTSALGVKGSEDLGNGMSAFFKVEWDADLVNGGSFKGRDQFIGLKMQRFGSLKFGTTSTAYKSPGSKIDAFYRTPLQSRAVGLQSNLHSGKGEEGAGRGTNMVRYDSPKMFGGLGFTGTYQFDSDKTGGQEDDDPYSLGLTYKGGNFYAAASYIDTQQGGDASAAQFLGKYTWNNLSVHAIYELDMGLITDARSTGTSEDDGADIWSAGFGYTIGNNLIGADFGQQSDSDGRDGIANTGDDVEEYDVWRIAAYHKFSSRTRVYAGYGNQDFEDSGEDEIFSLGMRHNF